MNGNDTFLRDVLADGRTRDAGTNNPTPRRMPWKQQIAESKARAAGQKPVVKEAPAEKPKFNPLTNDTAFVVVPCAVMNRLMDKADVTKKEIEERIEEEVAKMTARESVKFACARATEAAPIWVLISMVARIGQKVEALELAQVQFRAEAETNKEKSALVSRADKLGAPVVLLLESGDFEKPDAIDERLTALELALPAEAPKPTPTAKNPIEDKAAELAAKDGRDYKTAPAAIRGFYRKEAKRRLLMP